MQAVILAAGKSTRTYPLTLTRPKPMLKAANKPLMEHNLDAIMDFVPEVVVIVGYKKEMIEEYFGSRHKSLKIRYVEQKEQLGTAHALSLAGPYIKGRFVLMMGDDLYSKGDIRSCIRHRYSILAAKTKNPQSFGVIVERKGIMVDIVEKPQVFISDLISTALYVLDKDIFNCIGKIRKSRRGELELPDAVRLFSKNEDIHCVKSKKWLPVVYPWDLLRADRMLRNNKNSIGKNTKIQGKIENSSIGNNCIINGNVKNSIIMDNSVIEKDSIVEDSVIGEDVYFSGRISSKKKSAAYVKGKRITADNFGAVIADNCKISNSIINAGCRIWPGKIINNQTVVGDVE